MSRPSFIEPLMACSTAHVTKKTMDWITDVAADEFGLLGGPICYGNEFGAFVYVDDDGSAEADDLHNIPEDLRAVFALAREYDCCWIKLDCDATEIDALPVYDWDEAGIE